MRQILVLLTLFSLSAAAQTNKPKTTQAKKTPATSKTDIVAGMNPGDTGRVSFNYRGKPVTYTTVRAKDGNIWLRQNLGSSHVMIDFKDRGSWGDLFQWGRWDDGHQLPDDREIPPYTSATAPDPNNPAGLSKTGRNPFYYGYNSWWLNGDQSDQWTAATPNDATATNGCDPCRVIGQGWRLPTKDEAQNILKVESITDASTAFYSTLKLSNDGVRNGQNGSLEYSRGRAGVYWTSTPGTNGRGYGMQFNMTGMMLRGNGAAIRCIFAKP